ncbi:MAG: subclass B1 metallo-beta-lactamase [Saprospiraceae bacterium]
MREVFLSLIISIVFFNCTSNKLTTYSYESETLKVKSLSKHIFMHISYLDTDDFGKVACNGMVYLNGNEAIVFDTPTDNKSSIELMNWIERQGKEIKAVVITHFHVDCLGGLKAFHNKNVKSYATNQTIQLAKENNKEVLPESGFETEMAFKIGKKNIYAKFYGEGHTKDNIVGYIPEENALFGGCLIKSLNASKGYLGDANESEWSNTVSKIKKELPNLEIIIPGHGKNGGEALLDYTIQLFKK